MPFRFNPLIGNLDYYGQDAIGFTPENVSNKKLDLTDNSDTYYPSQKAVKTAVDAKQNSLGYTPVNKAGDTMSGTLNTITVTPTTDGVGTVGTFTKRYLNVVGKELDVSGATGTNRLLKFMTNSSNRWTIYTDNSTESGSNAGSNLVIARYNDASAYIGNAMYITRSTGNIGLGAIPTHTLTLPSTSTGIALYNTADQTTNYESVRQYWSGSVYNISSENGGTGTARPIKITDGTSSLLFNSGSVGNSVATAKNIFTSATSSTAYLLAFTGSSTASAVVANMFVIAPTINQSSTAGYTSLLINTTETSTGSGAKNLIDAQVGGTSKFKVDNTGKIISPLAQTYTVSNVITDRTFDANSTTLDEVADVLGTLIADLKAIGLTL